MKILGLIPENLHDQLFQEVAEKLEEKKKEDEEKKKKKAPTKEEIETIVNNIM